MRRLSDSSWCSGWSATNEMLVLPRRTAALGVTGLDMGPGRGGDLQRSSDACGCWPVVRLCCISAMLLVAGALVLSRAGSAPGPGGGERVEMGMELRPRGGELPAAAEMESVVYREGMPMACCCGSCPACPACCCCCCCCCCWGVSCGLGCVVGALPSVGGVLTGPVVLQRLKRMSYSEADVEGVLASVPGGAPGGVPSPACPAAAGGDVAASAPGAPAPAVAGLGEVAGCCLAIATSPGLMVAASLACLLLPALPSGIIARLLPGLELCFMAIRVSL